jgi:crotonobetainyl-CoA:carnitine CoA-transferase CaiB-like acyl-CoA transferase
MDTKARRRSELDIELGSESRGPLSGVRVIDVSAVVSGPLCGQILGDFGADVIKVESPVGDVTRHLGPQGRTTLSGLFVQYNRNKRSVTLDLKTDEGREAFLTLTDSADVLIENFRTGVAERLGIGFDAIRSRNPGIIYVAISGYGTSGPYSNQPAYDMVIQGQSGFATLLGTDEAPKLIPNLVADKTSGVTAAYSLLAALYVREKNGGRGQRIDIPMIDAFSSFVLPDAYAPQSFGGPPIPRTGDGVYHAWKTKDGHVAMLIIEDRQYAAMCRAIDREDLIEEEAFATLPARLANAPDLLALMEVEIAEWSTAELVERAHRFGAPLGEIHDIVGFLANPQVKHNRVVFDLDHPTGVTTTLFRSAPRFSETPTSVRRVPPTLGQHTDEVLREAGVDASRVEAASGRANVDSSR